MSKEWNIGPSKAKYDEEHGALVINLVKHITASDVGEFIQATTEAFSGMTTGRFVLLDVTDVGGGMMDKSARDAMKAEFDRAGGDNYTDKMAMVGASASARMMAKVILKFAGTGDSTSFFKTREEAFAWFKEV